MGNEPKPTGINQVIIEPHKGQIIYIICTKYMLKIKILQAVSHVIGIIRGV